ncbi:ABC transporter permease [Taklimakanibacter lacteus]|uniref:ABC transporter permease n=1 Tax=Taklimakanibacter lacteus TaxID=2268456 RepID=UPI000E675042
MTAKLEGRVIDFILWGSLAAVLIFFYVPIFTLIAFSFQEGRFLTLPFEGISLRWYGELFRNSNALTALWNSTVIAVVTTLIATAIGTMAAIVAVRYRFKGREAFQLLAGVPLAFPQLLLGIVLLLWFSVLGRIFDFSTGITTAIIGHIVYITPFAMVIVAVQVFNFDATVEDAARDCGASTYEVYRYVTIPLLWPGIFSAAIFAFLLSWGNFYLTYSLAGSTRTLPTFIFSGIAIGSSPLYPAIATVVFIPGILLVILANRLRRS